MAYRSTGSRRPATAITNLNVETEGVVVRGHSELDVFLRTVQISGPK